jgi:hypothetical protein
MPRRRTRVPGRYERPAHLRAPLGDHIGEAGIRDGFRAALRANAARAAVPTVEASTVATFVQLHEAAGAIREAQRDGTGRTYVIDIIRSGWNTSGSRYYSPKLIERDVPRVYPQGTQMYIDHPTASQRDEQPERSVATLAAVFTDTPWAVREDDGTVTMRTTARVFSPWQPLIEEAWPYIGVSINGAGTGAHGEAAGRTGLIMEELTYGQSVDFVTRPGAGGRVVGLMESAYAAATSPGGRAATIREAATLGAYVESRIHLGFTQLADDLYGEGRVTRPERLTLSGAIGDALDAYIRRVEADAPQIYQRGRWTRPDGEQTSEASRDVSTREATAEETRQRIQQTLQDTYASTQGAYCWYRDHDPDRGLVWFDAGERDPDRATDATDPTTPMRHATWQQSYQRTTDGGVTLAGGRIEVRQRTVYDPVRPAEAPETVTEGERPTLSTQTTGDVPSPDGSTGPAPDTTREYDMGEKSPEVVAREAAEARLATVEAERDTAVRERDDARAELARYRAGDTARPILDRLLAESDLPVPAHARLRSELLGAATLPLTGTGGLDDAKFRTTAEAAITAEAAYLAQFAEAAGAGRVVGMGAPAPAAGGALPAAFGVREADAAVDPATVEALKQTYMRRGLPEQAALAAASGRR